MDKEMSFGGFGFMAIFLLILFAMFSGNGFWGNRGFNNAFPVNNGFGFGWGNNWNGSGDIRSAICASEKQNIIDIARTQNLIEKENAETRATLGTKMDFYAYQDIRDQLAEAKARNMQLENIISDNYRYNSLQNELASIKCKMLTKPDIHGIGYVCNGTQVPPTTTTATPAVV